MSQFYHGLTGVNRLRFNPRINRKGLPTTNILFLYPNNKVAICGDPIDPMIVGSGRYNFHWIGRIYEDCKQESWLQKHSLFFNELEGFEKLDFIYYHKYCNPDLLLDLKRKYQCKLVYCFFEHPSVEPHPSIPPNIENADIHVHPCRRSQEVFQYGKPTFVVPEYEYMPYYDCVETKKHKKTTILWFGYSGNLQAMEQTGLDIILKDLLKKHDFNLKFISNFSKRDLFFYKACLPEIIVKSAYKLSKRPPPYAGHPSGLDFPKRRILCVRWNPYTFVQEAKKCHLAIVPLNKTMNKFDVQTKSANRARCAMACGLPVLADFSDGKYIVEDYIRTANDTEDGEGPNFLLCSDRNEWYENLDSLLSDVNGREKLAKRGYLAVKNRFNNKESLKTLVNKLEEYL